MKSHALDFPNQNKSLTSVLCLDSLVVLLLLAMSVAISLSLSSHEPEVSRDRSLLCLQA